MALYLTSLVNNLMWTLLPELVIHTCAKIRRFLDKEESKSLVHASVISKLDYCNVFLYSMIQVENYAARKYPVVLLSNTCVAWSPLASSRYSDNAHYLRYPLTSTWKRQQQALLWRLTKLNDEDKKQNNAATRHKYVGSKTISQYVCGQKNN